LTIDVVKDAISFLDAKQAIPYSRGDGAITIEPRTPVGFTIRLEDGDPEATLYCDGWHMHFSDREGCLKAFKWLFEAKPRLKVVSRGNYEYSWTLEWLEDDAWQSVSTTCLLVFPFWRRKQTRYKTNDWSDNG
jgi:hypothetical protein